MQFLSGNGRSGNVVERRLKRSPLIYHSEGLSFDLWNELFDYETNRDTKQCVQICDCFKKPPIALNLWWLLQEVQDLS
ncbi:hypothetical protein [Stenomitos frigidus]|uniref:Uncharacterized protein n=1 Tax=Stenomitos frigidus ULC18 TaxID=2107698 RepID=A0A2T1E0V0_9CYAN|nr:hypothetical protein [Stenomitos frigidus]PSB26386.1 hypothetical protein C7B82_19940 [Stenomitos frigidus ULC18]